MKFTHLLDKKYKARENYHFLSAYYVPDSLYGILFISLHILLNSKVILWVAIITPIFF